MVKFSLDFRFKPVPGKEYYLYYHEGRWKLSLVGPDEWAVDPERHHVASCRLLVDLTWEVETEEAALLSPAVQVALAAHIGGATAAVALRENMSWIMCGLPRVGFHPPIHRIRRFASGIRTPSALGKMVATGLPCRLLPTTT